MYPVLGFPDSLDVDLGQNAGLMAPNLGFLHYSWKAHLSFSLPGTATYIGATWNCILCLLRMAEEEEDVLVMCHGEAQMSLGKALLESG